MEVLQYIRFVGNWYPLFIPSLELCIPFNCCKFTFPLNINLKNHKTRKLSRIKSFCSPFWSLWSFYRPKTQIFLPFHILQLEKALPFQIPEAWKRYSFRVEPARRCQCRKKLPGKWIHPSLLSLIILVFWFVSLQFYEFKIRVNEITGLVIGREIRKRCGNEGWHRDLDDEDRTTLRFLRAANSFIPDAREDGANMRNCAFILRQPGSEFVIISGDGDWEYDFCEGADGEIYGRCQRMPLLRYAWDAAKSAVVRVFTFGLSTGLRALTYS